MAAVQRQETLSTIISCSDWAKKTYLVIHAGPGNGANLLSETESTDIRSTVIVFMLPLHYLRWKLYACIQARSQLPIDLVLKYPPPSITSSSGYWTTVFANEYRLSQE